MLLQQSLMDKLGVPEPETPVYYPAAIHVSMLSNVRVNLLEHIWIYRNGYPRPGSLGHTTLLCTLIV